MKLILTLIFLLVGCSSSNIEIESRISNQELERRLSESSNDRELLMSSFRLLIKSPSFNFDWARMWKDLSQRKPFFDSTDSTAWQLVFRAAKRSCLDGNPDARNQYLLYLFHLRSFSEFKQDLNPVLQYRVCEVQPSENVAEKIWTLELNQSDPDLETLSYALNGLQTSWLNQQPASTWDRLADLIILQLDGVGQIPSPSVELLAKLLTNRLLDQTSLSRLAFTALLSDETANAVGAFDSHNLNVIFALSGLQHASSSDQFHSWSMRALHIIVNAFLGGQINLKQSIQYNHEIFSHLSGHFGRLQFSKENGLKKWISGFDKVNDLYFIKLSQDPALKMEFLESFFRNISPKPQEVWLATMLEGTLPLSFHQQVLDSFIYSGNPLEQWLASRIILRNRLQKDINDLFPNRQDHHGLAFWGNDKQCPIPRISNGGLVYDREWINLVDPEQEISIGCYRVSDRYVFPDEVNLSYDSLIYAPGSDLLVNTLSRGIIDISGQTAARMDPPYQPAVAGKSFPVIFVQPQQSSSPHSRKYIIFHFVSQFPSQPSIQFDQMSQEEIDYFPYAPISESGGTLKLKNTPAYPVWIRSFPAAATAHFSAIKSVGPTVSQPLRHLHTLRQFLAEEYTGELVDFAPSLSEAALQGAANSASLLETARKFRLISLDKLDIFITRFGTSEAQKNFTDFIQKTNSNLASDLIESQYQDVLHGNLWEGHPFHLVSLFSPQGSTVIVNPKDGINPPIESSMRGISGTLPVDKKNIFSFVREESP